MNRVLNEKDYQRHIISYLVSQNGYIERKAAQYDKGLAMDREVLFHFLEDTQVEAMAALRKIYGPQTEQTILSTINMQMTSASSSQIETLKSGIELNGHHLTLLYGQPATRINPDLWALYEKNIFSVMEEVWINDKQRIDLVIFVNGIAVISFELKCEMSGQDYRDAVRQYSEDRDARNRLFLFKAGTIVNFAMDLNECWMTTKLDGVNTRFIPFNRGRGEGVNAGAGNLLEDGVNDFPTHYVWDDVLKKDSLIELITKFCFVQRKEETDETTGKKKIKESVIFPRYHQRDAVHALLDDVFVNHTSKNYLIQHSAGSGKTNTITWLAHRLSSQHDANDEIIYDNVLIVTDKIVVDRQLQNAVKSIDHKTGLIRTIGDRQTSEDLADALRGNTKIIVTTIQKFLYVNFFKLVQDLEQKRFAVIIDEAHSSTAGQDMGALSKVLGSGNDSDIADADDAIEAEVLRHGRQPNVSIFAFTATPKHMTLKLFGQPSPSPEGEMKYRAFHLYSMKQAIEEEYILDVLTNYIEYKTYYQLSKTIEDDPVLRTDKAKRAIARFVDTAEENVGQRVNIIVEHFRTTVLKEVGPWAKAMVITASREAAVRYRQALEDYITRHGYTDVKALVAFSGKVTIEEENGEKKEYTEAGMNGISEDRLVKEFDKDLGSGGYNVLLVANKYQVGFDQPKLCAMYVLKKLKGVNAVQTLSRLNRPCPPFDKKVFVMDFVNTCDDMEKAFAPYYTTTLLSNDVNVGQLRELENKIDGYCVLDDRDIETVAQIIYNPEGKRATAKDDLRVTQCIRRAINTLKKQYDEERQKEFQKSCRGFVRLYTFLSLASSFGDAELHKKYIFIELLLKNLINGNNCGVNLKDKINASNFVQQNQGDHGNKKGHASAPDIRLSAVKITLTESEEEKLSVIIEEINARAGKGMDADVLTKALLQIKDLLLKSEKLRASAKNNTEQDFAFSFYDDTDDALIEGLSQNQEFFTMLLNNDDVKRSVLGIFLHDVYQQLREGE